MSLNLVMTEGKSEGKISEQAIREELSRVLQSSVFAQSDRLGRFIRFTVETTLAGEAGTLKEYLIGTEVYERNSSYHPSEDSIVRSEARRLRSKLKEYYDSDGTFASRKSFRSRFCQLPTIPSRWQPRSKRSISRSTEEWLRGPQERSLGAPSTPELQSFECTEIACFH
jgi:hypothetical protein